MDMICAIQRLAKNIAYLLATCLFLIAQAAQADDLASFLSDIPPSELAPGADAYGPISPETKVAPVLKGRETIAWAFLTSDFVGTTGYSGKPIHVVAAIDDDAVLTGVKLVKHSEPIILIGIPNSKMIALTEGYKGLDLKAEAATGGEAHDLEIISGATVTIMIIDDSLVRAGIKLARALGLGGLAPRLDGGPTREVDRTQDATYDWGTLAGDGSVRRLTLDIGQINSAFAVTGDERAAKRPEPGDPDDTFIDLNIALVSVPSIGKSLLGDAEYANLTEWLEDGEQALLVLGRGVYSFKGSGYVRGGIFDRIQLIQGDNSVRFFDKQQRRLGDLATSDSPSFSELDIFKIPADAEFDPAEPFRLQLLAQRAVGAVEKTFLTFDLGYKLPEHYLVPVVAPVVVNSDTEEAAAKAALLQRIWKDKTVEIGILGMMLLVLTVVFFFQFHATANARVFYWFRISYLSFTLVFLGWYANAQLSVVNLMALAGSLRSGFSWDAFLMDPLVFIQWFAIAAALLFWGRGAYCGWLCPFGALQELLNKAAQALKIPQWTVPWGLHERLWPLKYMIFLGLFGLSMVSMPLAETYAEVEPFKTAIILKFMRDWPFVVFALLLLVAGLFVERFYCRYLCPLGGALAIPARLRMFDWLRRYKECGSPCQTCANECPVQAIHPTGEINPNECVNCLHCQVLYQSENKCLVVIKQLKRRAKTGSADLKMPLGQPPANHPNAKNSPVS
ncbi:4Fe-4S binding protein [Rhodobacterales bacterium 56_14_T64]|nr:4Fe-4S binding protein [Rhodobacterales bacterium 56_14_T64]